MQALVFDGARVCYDPVYPDPCPPPGEVLVRVTVAGVCSTDLEILRGYMSFHGVPGHEFVGVVEAAPDPAWVGRRVVGEINAACGGCPTCRAGRPTHCPQRTTLGISGRDGAFARYLTLPLTNLHAVPEEVPDAAAVFTEPLAAALEVLQQVHIQPTAHVALLGAGRLGQLLARVLRLTGCELVVWARYPGQAARLRRLGIDVRDSSDYPTAWADIVVEATGRPDGLAAARRLVRPQGILVLKSTYHGLTQADFTGLVVDEVTLVGSRCGPFAPALRLLASGLAPVEDLIDAEYPLVAGEAALAHAAQPGTLKVLMRMSDRSVP